MKPTKSFSPPRVTSRCVALDAGVTVRDVADACRRAALGFAWSGGLGWGKRELATWLAGPYARAVAVSEAPRSGVSARSVPPVDRQLLTEEQVLDLLVRTHAAIIEGVREASSWRQDASFAREMIDEGYVIGVVDASSAIGYAPVDGCGMRLFDRVRSLFLADFLTRPDDYAAFTVCGACRGATFDGGASHGEACYGRGAPRLRRRTVRTFRVDRPGGELHARPITLVGIGARRA
jgi:hypothetical protein